METQDSEAWAKKAVADGTWLLHRGAFVAGKAAHYFDGVDEKFISPENNNPVCGPVLQLDNGHAFLVVEDHFAVLAERDVQFLKTATNAMIETLKQVGAFAVACKVPEDIGVRLVVGALYAQARALEPQDGDPG